MANGAIETAVIEVLADLSNFDESMRKGVQSAVRGAVRRITSAFRDVESSAADTAVSVARSLGGTATAIDRAREPLHSLARALNVVEENLDDLGPAGRHAAEVIRTQMQRIEPAIVEGPIDALRRLGDASERLGDRLRASLGRAAVAGTDQLEASFVDLRTTASREVDLLQANVRESLGKLGNVPGLERLEAQFEQLERAVGEDLEAAIEETENNLRQMAQRGELSVDDLRGAVAQLATLMDTRLEEATEDVNRDLNLIRGHRGTFSSIASEVEHTAREMDRVHDETRKAALQMDRLDEEAEQATSQVRLLGATTRSSMARADSATGRVVARMNRLRFLFLDARFIVGGLGAFMAARFARFGIEAASSIEQARLSFQTIARSIEGDVTASFDDFRTAATTSLDVVIDRARETPFSLDQVADGVRRINAFLPSLGLASEEALGTMAGRTDIAIDLFEDLGASLAVLGQQDAMDRLIKALGDVGAAGRLMGEDMRQIRNALPGIEIRGAIIKGIFDPAVEASESIKFLRDEFTALGADATQAPQEALRAFVDLQARGLITTDAVVQGLRASLKNLAGDDALENFTLTIEGVIEKLREAAEVGSERGFRELGASLVEQVIPALERVEDASERFAIGLTDLAVDSIPLLLRAFEEATTSAGAFFDLLGDFVFENQAVIERAMEALFDVFLNLSEVLFAVFDATLPLTPAFLELVDVGLEAMLPLIEAITPLVSALADGISAIPAPALAAGFAFGHMAKGLRAMDATTLTKGAMAANLRGVAAAIARFGPATAAIAGIALAFRAFSKSAERGQQAADDLRASLEERFSLPAERNVLAFVEGIEGGMKRARQQIEDLSAETFRPGTLFGAGHTFNFLIGLDDLSNVDEIEDARSELAQLQRILGEFPVARFQRNMDIARDEVRLFADQVGVSLDEVELNGKEMELLLSGLGLELTDLTEEDLGKFVLALRDALSGEAGNFPTFLRDIGIEAGRVDFEKLIDQGATLEEVFGAAAGELATLNTELLKGIDPTFAVIEARVGLAEAEQELQDVMADTDATTADQEAALLGLIQATAELNAAETALPGALEEAGASLNELEGNLESILGVYVDSPATVEAAMSFLRAQNDLTVGSIEELARMLGLPPEAVAAMKAGIRSGAAGADKPIGKVAADVDTAVERFRGSIDKMSPTVRAEMAEIEAAAKSGSERFRDQMFNVGFAGVEGLISGIESQAVAAAAAMQGVVGRVVVAAEGGFLVESPSKVFRDMGHSVVDGLILGLNDGRSPAASAMASLVGDGIPSRLGSPNASPSSPSPTSVTSTSDNSVSIGQVVAPSPESAARRVATEVSDVIYLNTARTKR